MARPRYPYQYGNKRTHCLHCGVALAPHKELYCSSECGWKYRYGQSKIKGHGPSYHHDSKRGNTTEAG